MIHESTVRRRIGIAGIVAAWFAFAFACACAPASAQPAAPSLDVGTAVPDAAAVKEGLFPEDSCKELEASGFKCME